MCKFTQQKNWTLQGEIQVGEACLSQWGGKRRLGNTSGGAKEVGAFWRQKYRHCKVPDLSRERGTKNANASIEIEVKNFGLLPTVVEESTGLAREFRARDMMDDAYFTIEDFIQHLQHLYGLSGEPTSKYVVELTVGIEEDKELNHGSDNQFTLASEKNARD